MGSVSIPGYLEGVMSNETRNSWIVGLSFLTVVLHALTLKLTSFSRELTKRTAETFPSSPDTPSFSKPFSIACRIYTNALIVLISAITLLIIEPYIFFVAACLILIESWLVQHILAHGKFEEIGLYAIDKPKDFMRDLSNLNFIGVFITLIAVHISTGETNSMIAILSLLLARRAFQSSANLIEQSIELEQKRTDIEPYLSTKIEGKA